MIDYRLQKAGAENSLNSMLSFPALVAIFRATRGYPRKIVNLCHRIMLAMIVKNKKKAGWRLVRSCVNRTSAGTSGGWQKPAGVLLVVLAVAGFAYTAFLPEKDASDKREAATQQTVEIVNKAVRVGLPSSTVNPVPPPPVVEPHPDETLPVPARVETAAKQAPVESGTAQAAVETVPPVGGQIPEIGKGVPGPVIGSDSVEEIRPRPETLGMIRLEPGETLSWLMIKVYGEYTNQRRRTIAASNPGLRDLDNIYSGQAVGFPAMAYEKLDVPEFLHWVRVGRLATVSAALDLVRAYSTRAAPLRIVPTWQQDRDLQFDVIFWICFASQEEAARYLRTLPEKVQAKSEIMSGWERNAVFYANPCPGIG